MLQNTELTPVFCYLAAGAVGECVGSVVRVPAEAIKSTRQASDGAITLGGAVAKNFGDSRGRDNLSRVVRRRGTRVPFGEFTRQLYVPFGAVQIALFEALKAYLVGLEHPLVDGDSFVGEAMLGAFGGGVGAFISAPGGRGGDAADRAAGRD